LTQEAPACEGYLDKYTSLYLASEFLQCISVHTYSASCRATIERGLLAWALWAMGMPEFLMDIGEDGFD